MSKKIYRKIVTAWCMYDWANSAFATTIMAAFFPPFFRSVAISAGFATNEATALWGYTTAVSLLLAAFMAPILGAIADFTGIKKKLTGVFAGMGIVATGLFITIGGDGWMWAAILFIFADVGFAGANTFYESLLPHIAKKNDIDQISTAGYALGYVGGGILLIINVLWFNFPETFAMPGQGFAIKASFLSVSVWWLLFSIPLFRHVPEPVADKTERRFHSPLKESFHRLGQTFREIKHYKQLMIFLIAFWIYNDGIGTIIKMATAYGDEIGINLSDMIVALVITQFVGIPFSFAFGWLAKKIGTKKSIMVALCVYFLITIGGYFMRTATHFYLLALAVGTVQGGSQGLSRSLYGAMVPKARSAEFFGFFSTSSKLAGIVGPILFAVVSQLAGHSRLSILLLSIFFIIGGALLLKVDETEGIRVAQEENAAFEKMKS